MLTEEAWSGLKAAVAVSASSCGEAIETGWDGDKRSQLFSLKNHPKSSSRAKLHTRIAKAFEPESHAFITDDLFLEASRVEAGTIDEENLLFSIAAKVKTRIDSAARGIPDLERSKLYRKKELSVFIRNMRLASFSYPDFIIPGIR